jgi:hypothetical protein
LPAGVSSEVFSELREGGLAPLFFWPNPKIALSFSVWILYKGGDPRARVALERGMTEMTHQLTTMEAINQFVFAGNSTFTLRSLKTGARFTFKVEASEDGKVHFVKVLTGQNIAYLGFFKGPDYSHGKKSKITSEARSARAFQFFSDCLRKGKLHPSLEVYHEGKCGRCNRKLTTPASVLTGIGPDCAEIMGIQQVQPPKCEEVEEKARAWSNSLQAILNGVAEQATIGL